MQTRGLENGERVKEKLFRLARNQKKFQMSAVKDGCMNYRGEALLREEGINPSVVWVSFESLMGGVLNCVYGQRV